MIFTQKLLWVTLLHKTGIFNTYTKNGYRQILNIYRLIESQCFSDAHSRDDIKKVMQTSIQNCSKLDKDVKTILLKHIESNIIAWHYSIKYPKLLKKKIREEVTK